MGRRIHVEILIRAPLEDLWRLTQTPELHERWDLRFSSITYGDVVDGAQRFRYATRIGGGLEVEGWGETRGTLDQDGSRTSALAFGSDDRKALIRKGSGFWKYTPEPDGVRFVTGYDYEPRWGSIGRVVDLAFRPVLAWATAWSFDRLRLWLERDIDPTLSAVRALCHTIARGVLGFVFVFHGLVPKLIAAHPEEVEYLVLSGFPEESAPIAVRALGVVEILFGLALLWFWRARWLYVLTAVALVLLASAAVVLRPAAAIDPFNPISFTIALVALALIGWVACDDLPSAARCDWGVGGKKR